MEKKLEFGAYIKFQYFSLQQEKKLDFSESHQTILIESLSSFSVVVDSIIYFSLLHAVQNVSYCNRTQSRISSLIDSLLDLT